VAVGNLSPALEDYIEAILMIQKVKDDVRVNDVAEYLGVTMASVTGSMGKLAEMGLVDYEKRRGVRLTPEGRKKAEKIVRRHDELYTFYRDVLGADGAQAEESACRVEHVLDPSIIERISKLTVWVRNLPEGIADDFRKSVSSAAEPADRPRLTLDMVKPGGKGVVRRINARGSIGRRIMDMGITRGTELQVVRAAPLGDPVDIKVKGFHLSLRKSEASSIELED